MLGDVGSKSFESCNPRVVIAVRMVIVEIVDAVPLDPAAVVFDNRTRDSSVASIVKSSNNVDIGTWAGLASQASKDYRRVVAVVEKELVELLLESWQRSLGPLGVPRGVFHPEQDSHFIGELKVAFWRDPQADLHQVEAVVFCELQFVAPMFRVETWRNPGRCVSPIENPTDLQWFFVKQDGIALDSDGAKGCGGGMLMDRWCVG